VSREFGLISGGLELHPSQNANDRPYDYVVPANPYKVQIFQYCKEIHDFYLSMYGEARDAIAIRLGDDWPSYGVGDHINLPSDTTFWHQQGHNGLGWTLAHEYVHAIQRDVYGTLGQCTRETDHCTVIGSFCYNCATHFLCGGSYLSTHGSWNEGMADGMAEFWDRWVHHDSTFVDGDCDHYGTEVEMSVASFVHTMSNRDPRGFMDTWRNALFTYTGQIVMHATDIGEFIKLWDDQNPDPGWIVVHHPGTWNADVIYNHFIHGITTGVESERVDVGPLRIASLSPNPTVTRYAVARFGGTGPGGGFVRVYSVNGKLVKSTKMTASIMTIDLGALSTGIYFVRYESPRGFYGTARKLVVIH
jgi:hypothetical protein